MRPVAAAQQLEYCLSEAGVSPQDTYKHHEIAAIQSTSNEEKIALRQRMLVLARSQRDLFPVEGFIGKTDPLKLAEAHIQLSQAYFTQSGQLHQVKQHARLALADLAKKSVKSPPLLKYTAGDNRTGHDTCHGDQVEKLKRSAYKCLGEAYMEETPPALAKALEVFAKAVPGLPDFSTVLKKPKSKRRTDTASMLETLQKDEISDETSATLLKDLPFASSVGNCYQAAAGDLLRTLERLHSRNQTLLSDIRAQIMAIITMERSLDLELPNPSLCANAVCTVDLEAADAAACETIMDTVTSTAIAGSTPELATDHRRLTTMGNMSAMELLVRSAMCPLPAVSTANWMAVSPVQKLEQLCMICAMARAAKEPVAVLFSTGGVAEYVRSLLKMFEEQQYFVFGMLLGMTSGMTWQQKAGVLLSMEKKFGIVMSTEAVLAGVNMTCFRHILYFDYTPGQFSAGTCGLQHAAVTLFLQPREQLAVDVLQHAGVPLPQTPAELRPFQVETERGKRNSIEKVLQCCKDVTLRSAGVSAFAEYCCWYRNSRQVYILAPSGLDMPALRHAFLLPSMKDAISSMAHTFSVNAAQTAQRQALASGVLHALEVLGQPLSRMTKNGAAEEEVQPGLLENSIAAEEAVLAWSCIRQQRCAGEQNLKALVQSFASHQKKLRTLPKLAHAAADQAITLLYCVASELSGTGEQSSEREALEQKLWQAISEVQYISGRLILNDLNKPEQERLTACMQQLDQILMTQECHSGLQVVSIPLQAKTLKLYGKCAMKGTDSTAAGRLARQIDGAEARMLLGGVWATKGQYTQAGEAYEQAMKALKNLRTSLPADDKLRLQLEAQMIELLHTQLSGSKN